MNITINLYNAAHEVTCKEYILPLTDEEIDTINSYTSYTVIDDTYDLATYASNDLNELITLDTMYDDEDKLHAIIEFNGHDVSSLLAYDPDEWSYNPDVSTHKELGKYLIDDMGHIEVPDSPYIIANYEQYGYDYSIDTNGIISAYGWIEYIDGTMNDPDIEELITIPKE